MRANSEIEVKLAASPAMLEELRDHPALAGADSVQGLHTVYFDTSDARIGRQGGSLRVRQVDGGAPVQTFKIGKGPTGSISRHEWTAQIAGTNPSIEELPKVAVITLRRLLGGEVLLPFATLEVQRTVRTIRHGASTIEVAFDTGLIGAENSAGTSGNSNSN